MAPSILGTVKLCIIPINTTTITTATRATIGTTARTIK